MNEPMETDGIARKETSARSKDKAALKELRRARAASVEAAKGRLKEQQTEIRLVKKALAGGPRTVPETARETGLEASRVLYHVATLMKYGELREEGRDGAYFRYGLVPADSAQTEPRPETC